MECTCIRQTDLPGASRLFSDLVYHPDRTARFFSSPADFRKAAEEIQFSTEQRAGLVAALRELNPGSPLLDRLAEPGTVAVVTGQQVGLFSGPAYTLYKALTAVRLARQLTAEGIPAVPLFWLATEDHDFPEINHAWVFNARHEASKVEIAATGGAERPVGEIPLSDIPLEQLRKAMDGLPFAEEITARVQAAYTEPRTFGQGFHALLKDLLGTHEVLFVDPMRASLRALGAPMIRRALDAAPELNARLLERNKELEAAGYHAQVHVDAKTSLFFLLEGGRRQALKNSKLTADELKARAGQISPNALLRPVVQDFMIPTVAYIGGPAELSYFAQSNVLYQELLGRQPIALHRSGFTLIDSHSQKLLMRYKMQVQDFFGGEDASRARIAETLVPQSVARQVEETRGVTQDSLSRLKRELLAFDPTLAKSLNRSTRKIEYQMSKMEAKIGRQALLRNERATADAKSLTGLLYPHRHLQERFYSILPFLAKHGMGLVDDIYEHVHLDCPDHQLLTL